MMRNDQYRMQRQDQDYHKMTGPGSSTNASKVEMSMAFHAAVGLELEESSTRGTLIAEPGLRKT